MSISNGKNRLFQSVQDTHPVTKTPIMSWLEKTEGYEVHLNIMKDNLILWLGIRVVPIQVSHGIA